MPDPTPETYPSWREEWEREDGWRARKAEVNMLLAVIDQREDRICDLELDGEGHARFYGAAIGVIRRKQQGWWAWSSPDGLAWRRESEPGPLVTDIERLILDHAREAPDA